MNWKKLEVKFEYCYGIKKLEHKFKFSNRTFSIYAPNGVMKTSFAKTFYNYSRGENAKDTHFPERIANSKIHIDGEEVEGEDIFVIEPYLPDYNSSQMATLLADEKLKKDYQKVHKEIDEAKTTLLKKLKQLSGLANSTNIEKKIKDIFNYDFFDFILEYEKSILSSEPLDFNYISYQKIFDEKNIKFLETKDFKDKVKVYIEVYDKIIDESPYLGKDFKIHQADNVHEQLRKNNFFTKGHSVNLLGGDSKKENLNDEKLEEALTAEKNRILENENLQSIYSEIDKALNKNEDLRQFREYLADNQSILPELSNLAEFQKKIWLAYLVEQKELLSDLLSKYKKGQEEIKGIVEKAKNAKTDWEEVLRLFKERFLNLPFHLNIKNKEDVILRDEEVPAIQFEFKDGEEIALYENREDIIETLSMGEQRALYILNIMFEVEARKKRDSNTLFIIDDIADSFDYKNKYAIIDYLKEMSNTDNFYMLILSHNFDFYRTIQSRGISPYKQSLIALKNDDGIKLEPIKYLKNPFINDWKDDLKTNKKLIASIPFIRNIIEYTRGQDNDYYLSLTSILHLKNDTDDLTVRQLERTFKSAIPDIPFPNEKADRKVLDLIFKTAEECLDAEEGINLENKIVLSIAIRLKAEKFMTEQISDDIDTSSITENQYWILLEAYKKEHNNETQNIEILRRVNLITPENIHVNSFMYEPILDMGDHELRRLYERVRDELS